METWCSMLKVGAVYGMSYRRFSLGYYSRIFSITDYCRSVTIVTKTKTTFFTRKIDQFHPKTGQFRHFFDVKNILNFSNSSQQYSVNGNSTVNTSFWQVCCLFGFIFVKIPPKFIKSDKMTFGVQRSMCEKLANF